jgi:hypothetical protein
MKNSREILIKAGLHPKLRLGIKSAKGVTPTGPHRVKVIEDKIIQKLDPDGKLTYFVRFIFEEDGQKKQYDARMKSKEGTDPHYLVQLLAEVEEGEEIILEMKKAGIKNYIEVIRVSTGEKVAAAADEEDDHGGEDDSQDNLADDLATIHA